MTYEEYKRSRQSEFDNLPIFFAFSDEQFEKEMNKRGLTGKDTKKVYGMGNGGFYLKKDAHIIHDFLNKKDELPELMQNEDFAEDAFLYEMFNHELCYNSQGAWDVCSCFGNCEYGDGKTSKDYLKEMGYGEGTIKAYRRAKVRYYDKVSEWEVV